MRGIRNFLKSTRWRANDSFMIKIKAKMPTAIYVRPHSIWWGRFISFWRQITAERGHVGRQAAIAEVIIEGLDAIDARASKTDAK